MLLKNGYNLQEAPKEYRHLTFDEARQLASNSHVLVIDLVGNVRSIKVTSVKTWKTRPNNLTIKYQYGLFEFYRIVYEHGEHISGPQMVVEVK